MQNLKADTVLFLTRDGCAEQDRSAAKILAPCEVEVRHVEAGRAASPRVDVLIHAHPSASADAHASDAAGRIENAIHRASEHPVRFLQWVEEGVARGPRPATGAGDADSLNGPVGRANSGMPPRHRRDAQGHGQSQSPGQPGDRRIDPPPNPRR